LQQVFATDATLVQSGAVILGEPAAGYVSHEGYAALARAPYRHQEMLGVIWRENPFRWLKPDESPVLIATLMECDCLLNTSPRPRDRQKSPKTPYAGKKK
ncbi:IucA/IucC family protein, partial [Escherichia coli]|uniref:IucA/IucC family protein n=1 Tax=Escherichia coli TaxID=562 RepID=UPI002024B10B